jgi:hypothetical protein
MGELGCPGVQAGRLGLCEEFQEQWHCVEVRVREMAKYCPDEADTAPDEVMNETWDRIYLSVQSAGYTGFRDRRDGQLLACLHSPGMRFGKEL